MLQRIQTVYLSLAMLSLSGLFFFPIAELSLQGLNFENINKALLDGKFFVAENMLLLSICIIVMLDLLSSIFLFKNRKLQILVATAGNIGAGALTVGATYFASESGGSSSVGLALPAIAMILTMLAVRSIRKDEELVRSSDRLR